MGEQRGLRHAARTAARVAILFVMASATLFVLTGGAAESETKAALQDRAGAGSVKLEVSFPASVHAQPITGRALVVITRTDQPEPRTVAGSWGDAGPLFGVDVNALGPEQPAVIDATTSVRLCAVCAIFPRAIITCRPSEHLHGVSSRGRARRVAAHGSVGRATLQSVAGKFVQRSAESASRSGGGIRREAQLDESDSASEEPSGYGVGEAHQDPERTADKILGPSDVYRRDRAAAEGI